MHNSSRCLLGAPVSSAKDVSVYNVDPASFPAGAAVSQSSVAGVVSLLASAGMRVGVSMGRSLSDIKKTAVCRTGTLVPMRVALKRARGTITITNVANLVSGTDDAVTINGTAFTAQAGAATPGDATFQATGTVTATAQSLVAQINSHVTIGALVRASNLAGVVTIAAVAAGLGGNAITTTYTDNDTNIGATVQQATLASGSDTASDINFVTKGAKVYIDDISGLATENLPGSTISDAVYISAALTGVAEDSSTTPAALVDMQGGL